MAGHSQFKNIMYRKGAQDAKRAKVFSRLIRELTVAAKSGLPDPDMNPRLRSAIAAAKTANMPKDNIDRAIKRGAGGEDDTNFEEIRYEGYGPGGVAMIVETLTDNRNRTASEMRTVFNKNGGTLGDSGNVSFLFERIGLVHYGAAQASPDAMFEAALEAGANDVESNDGGHEIICAPDDLSAVRDVPGSQVRGARGGTPGLEGRQRNSGRRRRCGNAVQAARCAGRQRRRATGGDELRGRRRNLGTVERVTP